MALRINSMVKFYTLLLISEKPKHGYELMKELEQRLERKISASQVYPFLGILESKGFVSAGKIGERERKTYRLTKKGKAFTDRLIGRFGELVQQSIVPNLTLCAHCGCKVYGSPFRKRFGNNVLSFCCKYCAGSY